MKVSTLSVLISGAALAACATSPQNHDDRNEPVHALLSADAMLFVGFDTDGDFQTTTAEIDAGIEREFTRADSNHDGQLQPLEFTNWANVALGGGQIGPFRLDFDRNVDNVITREEFANEIHNRARDYDQNENGAVSRPELVRLVGQARPARPRVPEAPTPGGIPH